MQKSSLLIPGSNLLLAPAEKTWVPWSLNHQRNIQDFHQKDIRNHAPPTLDECYLLYISSNFLQECTFPPVTACHTNPKKRLTNLDDTLCSFPRVLWNSVTLWPCRCHSQVFGWLDHRERHGPSLKCLCVVSCHFFALKSFPIFCHKYGMDIRKGSKLSADATKKSAKPQATGRS